MMGSGRSLVSLCIVALATLLTSATPAWAAGADPTSTVVVCSPSSIATGASATCTVTVTDTASTPQGAPAGTVSFTPAPGGTYGNSGVCTLASAGSASSSCAVTFTPSSGGGYTINATYTPAVADTEHASSEGSTSLIAVDSTTTTVSCPATSATVEDPINCTVTVADPTSSAGMTGQIQFTMSPDSPGSLVSTCENGSSSTGASTSCTVTFTPPQTGVYTLTAAYGGDTYHASSTGAAAINVVSTASSEAPPDGSTGSATSGTASLPPTVVSPATGAPLGVFVLRHTAKLAGKRRVGIKLGCSAAAGGRCDGTVAVYLKVQVRSKKGSKVSSETRTTVVVEIGSKKVNLRKTGKKLATIDLSLSRIGRRVVRALIGEHKRSIAVTALVRQSGVVVVDHVVHLSLVAPKKAKHRKKKRVLY
jgi:hypothetical protein